MQAKRKRRSLPYSTNKKAWADAKEVYEKNRRCQKFGKHLREADIYRSFRAEAGSFIVHDKLWVGQSYHSMSENTGSLCAAVWLLSFVLLGLLLLTSLHPFQTLLSRWALSWVWGLLLYGILCSCRTWEQEVRGKTHPNPDWLQERLAPTSADYSIKASTSASWTTTIEAGHIQQLVIKPKAGLSRHGKGGVWGNKSVRPSAWNHTSWEISREEKGLCQQIAKKAIWGIIIMWQ